MQGLRKLILVAFLFPALALPADFIQFPKNRGQRFFRIFPRRLTGPTLLCEIALSQQAEKLIGYSLLRLSPDSVIHVEEIRDVGFGVTAFIAQETLNLFKAFNDESTALKQVRRQHLMLRSGRTKETLLFYDAMPVGIAIRDIELSPSGKFLAVLLRDEFSWNQAQPSDPTQRESRPSESDSALKIFRLKPDKWFVTEGNKIVGQEDPDSLEKNRHANFAYHYTDQLGPQLHELRAYDYLTNIQDVVQFSWAPNQDFLLLSTIQETNEESLSLASLHTYYPEDPGAGKALPNLLARGEGPVFDRHPQAPGFVQELSFKWSENGHLLGFVDLLPAVGSNSGYKAAFILLSLAEQLPARYIEIDRLRRRMGVDIRDQDLTDLFTVTENSANGRVKVTFSGREVTDLLREVRNE